MYAPKYNCIKSFISPMKGVFDMINRTKLETACKLILEGIGADLNREGLIETPKRFAKFMEERLCNETVTNEQIAQKYNKTFSYDGQDIVVLKNIDVFSFCEHHIALMYNMKVAVGYIPHGKVIGISKIARIADEVTKRLQLQEKIGNDIYECLKMILNTDDIIVYITGEHSCMTARGIKKTGVKTETMSAHGVFEQTNKKQEFLAMI